MDEAKTEVGFEWPPVSYTGKRFFDLLVAITGLLTTAPLFLLIGILIKITSRGPVFYKGERVGLLGGKFRQIKFRTMTVGHSGSSFTSRADPRVTPIGRVLRFFKLDELPQLLNVIRGEMSIVGPRPEDSDVVAKHYTKEHLRVLTAKPGLTCLLQVRIFPDFSYHVPAGVDPQRYYLEKILPERIEEDLEYVDKMSLWLDTKLVLQTAWCILVKSWRILIERCVTAKS